MKLTIQDGRDSFYTFDSNRILLLTATDEEQIKQVEFSTEEAGGTETWTKDVLEQEDGVKYVQVPNEFLNGDYTRLVCYAVALDSKGEFTRQKEVFRIKYRPQPEDWFLTYSERVTFASIKALTEQYKASALGSMNAAAASETNAENSADLARRYAEETENVEVETGKYSSKHWSIKTQKKFDEVKEYVGSSSEPNSALGSIENARVQAINDVGTKKDNSIAEIDTHVTEVAVPAIDEYVDKTANPEVLRYGKEQIDSYISGTSKPELDRYVNSDKKTALDQYTENEKKKVLDQYTENKKGELDSYTNTDKKKVLDDYVNNVKKVELNTYTNDKKSELDVYKTTKADELNEHTVSLKGSLDGYTTAKEQEISEFTEQKKQEVQGVYQTDLNELKGDLVIQTNCEIIQFTNGYYIQTDNDPVEIDRKNPSSTGLRYAIIDCVEGDEFTINGTGSYSARLWCFVDSNNRPIIQADANATVTNLILVAPNNANKLIINDKSGNSSFIGLPLYKKVEKAELTKEITLSSGYYACGGNVGDSVDLIKISSSVTKSCLVDCDSYEYITISGTGGQSARLWCFIDSDNKIISNAKENEECENKIIRVPNNAKKLILNSTSNKTNLLGVSKYGILNNINKNSIFTEINHKKPSTNNLCLCSIQGSIQNNRIPFSKGYLFHKLTDDDGTLYYGYDFKNIVEIAKLSVKPSDYVIAISPRNGNIIMTKLNQRGAMIVYDGKTEHLLFSQATTKPCGWLYNSGVEFTIDSNNNEICLFAEYSNSPEAVGITTYNVWRGVYPYTSETNWSIVFSQNYGSSPSTDITHFHQIRRDPWSGYLYLTSGDESVLSKWWCSSDNGLNWNLITDGQASGFEEHICRCINFVFTKEWIYFATDKGTNHCLNRIRRNSTTNIIDISTREKICDLPNGRATNSICYVESPNGIFMYDRIDIGYTDYYDQGFPVQFWSIDDEKLYTLMTIYTRSNTWGGHRGKCYINYTNSVQPFPAMGFSTDSPCIFDISSLNEYEIGTVYYEIIGRVLHTLTR